MVFLRGVLGVCLLCPSQTRYFIEVEVQIMASELGLILMTALLV